MTEFTYQYFQQQVEPKLAEEIRSLLADAQSLDDAWRLYGEQQGSPATGEDPRDVGKRTFTRRLGELRSIFCQNPSIQAVINNPSLDKEIDLATVLAGILLDQHFPGTQIAAIVVLIAKIGVLRLCEADYQS